MPKQTQPLAKAGQDYRAAKAAVGEHRRREAAIELERTAWLKAHRGVPSHLLYDRDTGDPTDPELIELEERLTKANEDTDWCRGLVIACGEVFKGVRFEDLPDVARQRANAEQARARAMNAMEG